MLMCEVFQVLKYGNILVDEQGASHTSFAVSGPATQSFPHPSHSSPVSVLKALLSFTRHGLCAPTQLSCIGVYASHHVLSRSPHNYGAHNLAWEHAI